MTAEKCEVTRCGLCRFFSHEGRRGGSCSQLNVNVSAQWTACSLGASPFEHRSKPLVGIADWTPVVSVEEVASSTLKQSASSYPISAMASSVAE